MFTAMFTNMNHRCIHLFQIRLLQGRMMHDPCFIARYALKTHKANAADASIAFSQMVSFISMNMNKTN